MRRVYLVLVLVLLSVSLVYAGGQKEGAEKEAAPTEEEEAMEKAEVTISTWMSLQEVSREMMLEIEDRFEQENPNINLKYIDMPFEQRVQQTMVAVSGGNPPDIVHLTAKDPYQLAAMGALADLMPWFEDDIDDIPEATLETGMLDGKLISVPLQLGTIVVLAMKKNLSDVGFAEEVPETWTELKTAVAKISNISDKHFGFAARTAKHPNSAFWFFPVMYGHGGQFEDEDGNVIFDSEENIAALDWYRTIGTEKQTPMGMAIPESRNLFAQGKVGFLFDGPWMKAIMRNASGMGEDIDDEYTVSPFPKGPDGTRKGINNNHVLSVSRQSDVKDEAVAFIKFWSMDPEITDFHYQKMGAIPAYKSLQARDTYSDLHPLAQSVIDGAGHSVGAPSKKPEFNAALEFIAAGIQEALLGGDPEQIAEKTAESIRTLYGQ